MTGKSIKDDKTQRWGVFRELLLNLYGHTCAATGTRFHSPRHTEAVAAHIVSKEVHGTDDPRNGIALSGTSHWAFDRGIFTISDEYEIVVNPKAKQADHDRFSVIEMQGEKIRLPEDEGQEMRSCGGVIMGDKCEKCGFGYRICSACKTVYCAKCAHGRDYLGKIQQCPKCYSPSRSSKTRAASASDVARYKKR